MSNACFSATLSLLFVHCFWGQLAGPSENEKLPSLVGPFDKLARKSSKLFRLGVKHYQNVTKSQILRNGGTFTSLSSIFQMTALQSKKFRDAQKATGLRKSFLTKETNINIFGNTNIILNTSRRENSRCAALWKCHPALGSAQALLRHSSKNLAF